MKLRRGVVNSPGALASVLIVHRTRDTKATVWYRVNLKFLALMRVWMRHPPTPGHLISL